MTETRRIRIGNDIRLAVDLRQYVKIPYNALKEREVYTPNNPEFEELDDNDVVDKNTELYYEGEEHPVQQLYGKPIGNPISIRSVKAIFINTTKQQEHNKLIQKKSRFINRFPVEPDCKPFEATQYNICNSGYPTYRAYPGRFYTIPYSGYGIYPNFGGLYKQLVDTSNYKYTAEVYATEKQNIVEVSFPAQYQMDLGKYTLVLVVKAYAPGYNSRNLKTITVDMPDVFELVGSTEEGINTGVSIRTYDIIDNLSQGEEYIPSDIYIDRGMYQDNNIMLERNDGQYVNIDLSSATGWYEGD